MSRSMLYFLIAILLLSACQPGNVPSGIPVKPVMTLVPGLITEPPFTLTGLPEISHPESTTIFGSTPIQDLPPLLFEVDPAAPTSGDFQTYRLTLNLTAWETKDPALVQLHLPANATLTGVSATGWTCEQVTAQDELQPDGHFDVRCQNRMMGRSVQPLVIIRFTLSQPADGIIACAQIATKDVFSPPVCVTLSL